MVPSVSAISTATPPSQPAGSEKQKAAEPFAFADFTWLNGNSREKAAAYGYHLCKNHPFVDGNKRVAFVLMDILLQNNGWTLTASEEDAYSMMISLADGRLTQQSLAKWLKIHSTKSSG